MARVGHPDDRPTLVLAGDLAALAWIAEGFGGIFSRTGTDPNTGPLLVLLAATLWPLSTPAYPREPQLEQPFKIITTDSFSVADRRSADQETEIANNAKRFGVLNRAELLRRAMRLGWSLVKRRSKVVGRIDSPLEILGRLGDPSRSARFQGRARSLGLCVAQCCRLQRDLWRTDKAR